jgi:dehydrogenase/reductase SDR family protein 12
MVCRDRARGEAALAKLRAELAPPPPGTTATAAGAGTPGPALTLHVCDVSLQRDVAAFADAYARSGAPLHCLVNNAGCMVHERTATREGVETNFATNTLGAYNLTRLLEPALRRAGAEARVVFVASAGALTERLEVEDVESEGKKTFDGARAYAKQKRHQMALCERFAEAEESGKKSAETSSIGYYCMHPGWSDTEAVRVALPGFYDALRGKLRSPAEGADTVAWLCVAPKSELRSGGFYLDRREVPAHVSASAWFGTRYAREDVDALIRVLDEKTEKALRSDAPSTNTP